MKIMNCEVNGAKASYSGTGYVGGMQKRNDNNKKDKVHVLPFSVFV